LAKQTTGGSQVTPCLVAAVTVSARCTDGSSGTQLTQARRCTHATAYAYATNRQLQPIRDNVVKDRSYSRLAGYASFGHATM